MGSNNRLIPGINDLATVNPSISKEWNYLRNGGLTPDLVAANTHRKVWWKCSFCGKEWETSVSTRNTSGRIGCPNCNKKRAAKERRESIIKEGGDFASVYPELLDEWNYEKNGSVKPTEITAHSDSKVWWRCKICGKEWKAWIGDRARGVGCPRCFNGHHTSYSEQVIYYYVKQAFPDAINGYKLPSASRKEIDIYVPTLQMGIEYDGEYWHKDIERDEEKNRIVSECGIHLVRIREKNCPKLNDKLSYVIAVDSSGNYENNLETAIQSLFMHIENNYNTKIDITIDVKKDATSILALYEHDKKSESVDANEALKKDWNYERNGELKPYQIHLGSKRKVWWKCNICGYEWKAIVADRSRGIGCPACSGKAVRKGLNDLQTIRPDIATEWNYEKNGTLKPDQVHFGSNKDVWWICSKCGNEWHARVMSRKMLCCPKCNYKRVADNRHLVSGENDIATLFPELMKDWDYEKNDCDPTIITAGSHRRVHWKCHKCGYRWVGNVYDRTSGHGCPNCAKSQKSDKLRRRNLIIGETDLASKYPEIAKDWDYDNNEMTPEEVSYGSSRKVHWVCSNCGNRWEATISNRTNRKSQCPKCHGKVSKRDETELL